MCLVKPRRSVKIRVLLLADQPWSSQVILAQICLWGRQELAPQAWIPGCNVVILWYPYGIRPFQNNKHGGHFALAFFRTSVSLFDFLGTLFLLVNGPVNVQNMAKDGLQHTSRLLRQQAHLDLDPEVAHLDPYNEQLTVLECFGGLYVQDWGFTGGWGLCQLEQHVQQESNFP